MLLCVQHSNNTTWWLLIRRKSKRVVTKNLVKCDTLTNSAIGRQFWNTSQLEICHSRSVWCSRWWKHICNVINSWLINQHEIKADNTRPCCPYHQSHLMFLSKQLKMLYISGVPCKHIFFQNNLPDFAKSQCGTYIWESHSAIGFIFVQCIYLFVYTLFICMWLLFIIPVTKTLFLTIVLPEEFVMVHIECCRETETAIFDARTNLPVLDFQTWQVWLRLSAVIIYDTFAKQLNFNLHPIVNQHPMHMPFPTWNLVNRFQVEKTKSMDWLRFIHVVFTTVLIYREGTGNGVSTWTISNVIQVWLATKYIQVNTHKNRCRKTHRLYRTQNTTKSSLVLYIKKKN